ncbi:MAG: hypothetical protein WDZ53_04315 [Balneolales bacterium]
MSRQQGTNTNAIKEIVQKTTMTEEQALRLLHITEDIGQVRGFARLKDYGLPVKSIFVTAALGATSHDLKEVWQDMMGENIIVDCHHAVQKMKSFLNSGQ